uniref:Uncharacterized protein n=1 Tax=Arion vulgaris TaxID=1028688 RepID=A0A0B7BBY2_9EUPU
MKFCINNIGGCLSFEVRCYPFDTPKFLYRQKNIQESLQKPLTSVQMMPSS